MKVEFPLILVELLCILICRCKKLSVAKKQMFVSQAPNVLVVQLKVRKPLLPCVYDCIILKFYVRLVLPTDGCDLNLEIRRNWWEN